MLTSHARETQIAVKISVCPSLSAPARNGIPLPTTGIMADEKYKGLESWFFVWSEQDSGRDDRANSDNDDLKERPGISPEGSRSKNILLDASTTSRSQGQRS
ncbi:hypothetical protein IV203_031605 [Nitzschia inconspicua]|uniref:Uncharacterized protein n=1 Tax=Nitzschia inconspicua TaxID=303405 RepID=A0A9K3Q2J3_9STRA|nr:hypothetical protein IV203_011174 [Nitzschia inconspicua]KAG7368862.1 hypothetical protein IV203_031605 [Nitzschia inconspicua]